MHTVLVKIIVQHPEGFGFRAEFIQGLILPVIPVAGDYVHAPPGPPKLVVRRTLTHGRDPVVQLEDDRSTDTGKKFEDVADGYHSHGWDQVDPSALLMPTSG